MSNKQWDDCIEECLTFIKSKATEISNDPEERKEFYRCVCDATDLLISYYEEYHFINNFTI